MRTPSNKTNISHLKQGFETFLDVLPIILIGETEAFN